MHSWFRYFLGRSLIQRRGRFVLSAAAVMLAVSVVTALATISLGVREKIGAELKQYGANMIVTRPDGLPIAPADADAVRPLADAWWTAATSNHHDFITGTSPDPVVEGEQGDRAGRDDGGVARSGTSIA